MGNISRVIISVFDKKNIIDMANCLKELKVEIFSTGGTAELLKKNGINVTQVSDYTGFPEIMDGRVKTLHPKIHGGLLGRRDIPVHMSQMEDLSILPIEMVIINLYPFETVVEKDNSSLETAIENIDIGGPALIRSGAKNYKYVTVVTDISDYPLIIKEMQKNNGIISEETNFYLAKKAFGLTARYDGIISNYLGCINGIKKNKIFPDTYTFQAKKVQDLRYGENPHQRAAFYKAYGIKSPSIALASKIQGKELSFNNILDLDSAIELTKEFKDIVAVIIKHTNPCGVAISHQSLNDAYIKARDCDPVSAFGSIVGFNREVDENVAREVTGTFIEAIIAPGYSKKALDILNKKKDLRVLSVNLQGKIENTEYAMKKVVGGLLLQEQDSEKMDVFNLQIVTKRVPAEEEYKAMDFTWKVVKHVKSNAIVYGVADRVLGIGAGQMSRVDSARIAGIKAGDINGAVMASDAMLPFKDSVEEAAKLGITAIIQPGGSLRDKEVIEAADKNNMSMVFTGVRHFRH
ncbi:MAG: bifunctional phosphoribosylaminoimidazolecarboxamide formyltransferase/IMP cyclohydrolase [Thermodesulfobacteriota bacterium]|nr:bifunctional phosphoribosylaminoimidazolecarboxamide formyltransferase/IMP cyclohydrolase [Thermodesulfobacteriota bacterium]